MRYRQTKRLKARLTAEDAAGREVNAMPDLLKQETAWQVARFF